MLTTQTRMREIGLALIRAKPILDSLPEHHPLRVEFMRLACALPLENDVIDSVQAEIFAAWVQGITAYQFETA